MALRQFAIENDEMDLISSSLSSTGVKEYIERTGEIPPHVTKVTFEQPYNRAAKTVLE